MKSRTIVQIAEGLDTQDGAGVKLKRIIGQRSLPRLDPFLMLDEFGSDDAQDYIAGFPEHPHRGFQTVTYMLEGKMEHRDSVGNVGLIESGGIQWMNAGKGIIHAEMPKQTEGMMRGFQLWVNLPAAEKMSEPAYQDIPADCVPEVAVSQHIKVKVLSGSFSGVAGPVATQAVKPLFLDIAFAQAGELTIPIEEGHNAFIYCFAGSVQVEGQILRTAQLGVLGEGDELRLSASGSARAILVGGQPIGEPVVQYGPFVMNTQQQIEQALRDFQNGVLA
jgi:redox-sensitive bicupin YhaK (pirin superfamily)